MRGRSAIKPNTVGHVTHVENGFTPFSPAVSPSVDEIFANTCDTSRGPNSLQLFGTKIANVVYIAKNVLSSFFAQSILNGFNTAMTKGSSAWCGPLQNF